MLHYLLFGLLVLVDRNSVEKVLKGHDILMRLLQLLWVSPRPAEQRTPLADLAKLVLETYQVVLQVVDLVLDLLRPVRGDLRQTPVELLKCPQVVLFLVLGHALLVRQFTYQAG